MRKARPLRPRPSNAARGRDVDQHLDRNSLDNAHRSPKGFTGSDPIPMIVANTRPLESGSTELNQTLVVSFCLSMIFSENRFPPIGSWPEGMLFRIMLKQGRIGPLSARV